MNRVWQSLPCLPWGVAIGMAIFLRGVAGVAPLVLHLIYIYIAIPAIGGIPILGEWQG